MNLKLFLEDHELSFLEINPILIKNFSSTRTLRRTKTDKIDASLISLYLTSVEYKIYPTKSYHIRNLKSLTRSREELIKERFLHLINLTNVLDLVFPEFKPFFNNSLKSATCLYLLENYTSPSKMANMTSASYKSMSGKLRRTLSYVKFNDLRLLARNTIGHEDGILIFRLNLYLELYKTIDSKIQDIEHKIEDEFQKIHTHIHTIKGIGLNSAASIYAEYGSLDAFDSPNKMLAWNHRETIQESTAIPGRW